MFRKILLVTLFSFGVVLAKDINIAVAANVSYAIDELIKEFNKTKPNTKVRVTLGSSGKLTAQIKNGAPYDVFMAANMKYPNSLYDSKKATTKPIVYAKGALAYLSRDKKDFSKGIDLLKDIGIKKIAIANPKTAPYGKASIEAMKNSKTFNDIKSKLIYAETVSQTVSYTLMACDIGIIAKSSLYSDKMKRFREGVNWNEVDSSLYTPINQGIVIIKDSKDSKAFYDFILSQKAKEIFKKYGYIVE
jgi:molybdate transport system substrate-binding protein